MIQNFDFRALPVLSPGGEDPSDNETRFRREVERAFRFGDTALQGISKQIANLIGGGPGVGPYLPLTGGTLTPLLPTNVALTIQGAPGAVTADLYLKIIGGDGTVGFTVGGSGASRVNLLGLSPNIVFTEDDQIAPAGQYRIIGDADTLLFQKLTGLPATYTNVLSLASTGVTLTSPVTAPSLIMNGNATTSIAQFDITNPIDANVQQFRFGRQSPVGNMEIILYNPGTSTVRAFLSSAGTGKVSAGLGDFGGIHTDGEIILEPATTGQIRWVYPAGEGGIGVLTYVDSSGFYLMLTDVGAALTGSYNSLRPFYITKATGLVNMNAGVLLSGVGSKLTINGGGLSFGSNTAASVTNLSEHIDLYGGVYGFSITGSRLNYVVGSTVGHHFIAGTADTLSITNGAVSVAGTLTATGVAKLATTGFVVEVGGASGSQINFMRTSSLSYLIPRDATTLRVQNVTGTAWASVASATGWTAGSDQRLKKDIVPLDYGLAEIMRLRPKRFRWRDDNRLDIGLIGQQVRRIIPEAVVVYPNDPDFPNQIRNMLGLHKDSLIPVLINAVQELAAQLKRLEAKIAKA